MESNTTQKIVKVTKVEDTREFEEITDGRWMPVAGTGTEHECCRCGRIHLVHAHVELDDGSQTIVGTGCMLADEMDVASRIRSAARRATTLRKLYAERAKLEAQLAHYNAAKTEVEAMNPGEPVEDTKLDHEGEPEKILRLGDATVYLPKFGYDMAERKQCVLETWRDKRMYERNARFPYRLDDLNDRIRKLEAKSLPTT